MKRHFLFFSLFFSLFFLSQKNITSDYIAAYNVEYPIFKTKNTEQFLLYIDSKNNQSFYLSTNRYVLDSLKNKNAIKYDDYTSIATYQTGLGEEVLKKENTFNVYETIVGTKLKYSEQNKIKWTILNDKKKYFGYVTRKAVTNIYGRKWIAWYAEDLPLNFGPYKFCGLPGIIINLYDEKAEYKFTLSVFKKKTKQLELPNDKKYKVLAKKDFKTAKYNINSGVMNAGIIFDDPNEKKRMTEVNERRIKESPNLDIE